MAFSVARALQRAQSLANRGDIQSAEKIYISILEKFPANERARRGLASLGASRSGNASDPSRDQIADVLANYNRGDFHTVLSICENLARQYPASPVILNFLGAANVGLGRFEEAAGHFRRMLQINPDNAEGHANLGHALKGVGRLDEAVECFRKALQLNPASAPAHNSLGVLYQELARDDQAIACFEAALKLDQNFAEAHYNLANSLHKISEYDRAIAHYENALRIAPDDAEIPNNLGVLFEETGEFDKALACYEKSLSLDRRSAIPHYNLGRTLQKLHRNAEAIEHYGRAIEIDPDHAEALASLGTLYQELDRCDESIECLTRSLRINPRSAEAHNNLGNTFQAIGNAEEAAARYHEALTIRPAFGEAHHNLSQVTAYAARDPHVACMLELIDRPELPEADRIHLSFALGKAFDDIGDQASAFYHYAEGNRLFRKTFDYDIADDQALFDRLKSAFAAPCDGFSSRVGADRTPIFIVGMPRSGTTLVEQILAAHSRVHGAGELTLLGRAVNGTGWTTSGPNAETFRAVRETYLSGVAEIAAN